MITQDVPSPDTMKFLEELSATCREVIYYYNVLKREEEAGNFDVQTKRWLAVLTSTMVEVSREMDNIANRYSS